MEANPEMLRAFAGQVDTAAEVIRDADVGTKATTAADGVDGSATQWAARIVGAHIKQVADDIAANIGKMGAAVRGAGDTYEVKDAELAGNFGKIF